MKKSKVISLSRELDRELEKLLSDTQKDIEQIQAEVARLIVESLSKRLTVVDGLVNDSAKNVGVISRLDTTFDLLYRRNILPALKSLAERAMRAWELAKNYFVGMGEPERKVERALGSRVKMLRRLGIGEGGQLIAGGYLDRLGRSVSVRDELKEAALQLVSGRGVSLAQFQTSIKNVVEGVDGVDGALVRYWRQYAFDKFNEVHEIANQKIADNLGLQFFIYEGSLIKNSREFCQKRAGKVFHVSETKTWKDDPTLPGKNKAGYDPLIERGRYNCRHAIRYISDELALRLRPDVAQFIE